jgi:hypothetical protein
MRLSRVLTFERDTASTASVPTVWDVRLSGASFLGHIAISKLLTDLETILVHTSSRPTVITFMKLAVVSLFLAITAIRASPAPRFEVASIRPAQPGATVQDARFHFIGDRFEAEAVTVGDILYMLVGSQLNLGPSLAN